MLSTVTLENQPGKKVFFPLYNKNEFLRILPMSARMKSTTDSAHVLGSLCEDFTPALLYHGDVSAPV